MTTTQQIFKPSKALPKTAMSRARDRISKLVGVQLRTKMDEVRLTQNRITIAIYDRSLKELGANAAQLGWVIRPRTLTHRKTKQESLTREESGRWLRAAKIQALAEEVFGNREKASSWLRKERKQFGGQCANTLIQNESGAQLVEDTLNQIDAGYFA